MTGKFIFSDDDIIKLEALGSCLSKYQIADYFCISRPTLDAAFKRQESALLHYKRGKAKCIAEISGSLIENAKDGDTAACCFYLKTQAGWKESKDDTSKVQEAEPIRPVFTVAQPKSDIKVTNGAE